MSSVIIIKDIFSGAPIIRGRTLTVFNVLTKIYYEDSLKTALDDYEITLDEAKDAVGFCSALKMRKIIVVPKNELALKALDYDRATSDLLHEMSLSELELKPFGMLVSLNV